MFSANANPQNYHSVVYWTENCSVLQKHFKCMALRKKKKKKKKKRRDFFYYDIPSFQE